MIPAWKKTILRQFSDTVNQKSSDKTVCSLITYQIRKRNYVLCETLSIQFCCVSLLQMLYWCLTLACVLLLEIPPYRFAPGWRRRIRTHLADVPWQTLDGDFHISSWTSREKQRCEDHPNNPGILMPGPSLLSETTKAPPHWFENRTGTVTSDVNLSLWLTYLW